MSDDSSVKSTTALVQSYARHGDDSAMERAVITNRLDALSEILQGVETLTVVCHNSPDPDCLASALLLEYVVESIGVPNVELVYSGRITHQQDRAFVNLLDVELDELSTKRLAEADRIAFVDHAIPGVNNQVPRDTHVDIVIDHHEYDREIRADYLDLRPQYAATTTILVEYLRELEADPPPPLASAALFALHRETLDFVRSPTAVEYATAEYLLPQVDYSLVESMYGAMYTPTTVDVISEAIRNRDVRGSVLAADVGRTSDRDAIPQAADYLLNLEGVDTTLVFGVVDEDVKLSARSIDPGVDVSEILRDSFDDVGSVGGRYDEAGGQIPLGLFAAIVDDDEELVPLVSIRVTERFFDSLNLSDED